MSGLVGRHNAQGYCCTSPPLHSPGHLSFRHGLPQSVSATPSVNQGVGGRRVRWDGPVFIITCVVARLTFFLNPEGVRVSMHGRGARPSRPSRPSRGHVPAHDMVGISAVRFGRRGNVSFGRAMWRATAESRQVCSLGGYRLAIKCSGVMRVRFEEE